MSAAWIFASRVIVRCAGLPVSWLLELQSDAIVGAVADVLAAEDRLEALRGPLLGTLGAARRVARSPAEVRQIRRVEARVRARRPAPSPLGGWHWAGAVAAWSAAAEAVVGAKQAAWRCWRTELPTVEQRLRDRLADPRVEEAVLLNSPQALSTLRRYRSGRGGNRARRVGVRYLQRFCAKTDTASFYGPVNYADIRPGLRPALTVRVLGDGTAARRRVLLAYWAAQAIADSWARDPQLEGLLRLYRTARTEASQVDDAELFAVATGAHALAALAAQWGVSVAEVRHRARAAEERGWLRCGLRVPTTPGDPLEALRGLLTGPDTAWPGPRHDLALVQAWLADFARADLTERERLLPAGQRLLDKLCGALPPRQRGTFYADRFFYTEEAVGNLGDLVIGEQFAGTLAGLLGPALDVLASAAVNQRESQHRYVRELADAAGRVPANRLSDMPPPHTVDAAGGWDTLLAGRTGDTIDLGADELYSAGLLRDDLDRWPLFCAPDLMLVAPDPDALAQGRWQVVLAEAHHICPPTQLPFATFEPEPERIGQEITEAVGRLTSPAVPTLQGVPGRLKVRDYSPAGHLMLWLDWRGAEPGVDSVDVAECVVTAEPGQRPALRGPDGQELALFPEYSEVEPAAGMLGALALPAVDKTSRHGPAAVTPRITMDRLIYQRKRWRIEPPAVRHTPRGSLAEFLAVWRWKVTWGLPDQVFVRVATEEKPLLVDFRAPLSVDAFLSDTEGNQRLELEEMLPSFDQLWLGADGERYCAELRLTAFRGRRPDQVRQP